MQYSSLQKETDYLRTSSQLSTIYQPILLADIWWISVQRDGYRKLRHTGQVKWIDRWMDGWIDIDCWSCPLEMMMGQESLYPFFAFQHSKPHTYILIYRMKTFIIKIFRLPCIVNVCGWISTSCFSSGIACTSASVFYIFSARLWSIDRSISLMFRYRYIFNLCRIICSSHKERISHRVLTTHHSLSFFNVSQWMANLVFIHIGTRHWPLLSTSIQYIFMYLLWTNYFFTSSCSCALVSWLLITTC